VSTAALTAAEYCREIEGYLCRRNEGHLIRIVGPAFEKVSGWADQGVPIKVAFRGIDRFVERHVAKGPRRRPVRIEFCEADILDAFDEWRRAVGAAIAPPALHAPPHGEDGADPRVPGPSLESATARPRRVALQGHIDRVMARLTQRRLEAGVDAAVADAIDGILRELEGLRARAHGARGDLRDEVKRRLRDLDEALIGAVRAASPPPELSRLEADARRDLQPFKDRMPTDAFAQAVTAATTRLLREAARVPDIAAGV
jgi:hypothetical protein